jgi:hypothetical protein
MRYAATDMTQIMGIGSYVGELRRGPDGNLYEWVAGVDGLGNPIGFWKKAFRFVKGAVRAGLSRLIPGPIKRMARKACGVVDQLGPAVSVVPVAAPYYAGAKGFCKVLRGAGIAGMGYGVMEVPEAGAAALTAAIPAPVRAAAKTVCGIIDRIGPVVKYIPVASSYYKKASGLCRALRSAGIGGADASIVEAPDGRLYEVVEGIGEFGERRRYLRPIRLVIPAYIGRRRVRHRGRPRAVRRAPVVAVPGAPAPVVAVPGAPAPIPVAPAPMPVAPAPTRSVPVSGFGRFY